MHIRTATTADVSAIARVHVESWRTTYKGLVPDDYLASLAYKHRELLWREVLSRPGGQGLVYVAEDAPGDIVGFASGGPERSGDPVYTGELYAIYLLESWQRRGLGRQLTVAVVSQLIQLGFTSLLIWVLAENPSRRFYEALGGHQVREKLGTTAGVQRLEVAYGWRDARTLIGAYERPPRVPGAQGASATSPTAASRSQSR
jgi:GNAT superfamily N-acetyltransferase